jgi:hypothetical protein
MVTIIELPPQSEPHQLTARAAVVHLGEHFESFLAANNLRGWYPDANYVFRDDRLADQFVLIALSSGLSLKRCKITNKRLRKIARASGCTIKCGAMYEMLAHALGYSRWYFAYKCRTVDDFIENTWPLGGVISLASFDEQAIEKISRRSVDARMAERYRYNKIRDKHDRVK